MITKQDILDALAEASGPVCDGCLLKITGLSRHQQVNSTCRELQLKGRLKREKADCRACDRNLLTNQLIAAQQLFQSESAPDVRSEVGIETLDALRRELIQWMNRLEATSSQTGFSKRVIMLRDKEIISATMAALMLTHATFRNHLYYVGTPISTFEQSALVNIDKALRMSMAIETNGKGN